MQNIRANFWFNTSFINCKTEYLIWKYSFFGLEFRDTLLIELESIFLRIIISKVLIIGQLFHVNIVWNSCRTFGRTDHNNRKTSLLKNKSISFIRQITCIVLYSKGKKIKIKSKVEKKKKIAHIYIISPFYHLFLRELDYNVYWPSYITFNDRVALLQTKMWPS